MSNKSTLPIYRIVFWQNMLAFHQSATICALAALPGYQVVWVVKEAVASERGALGWDAPETSNVQVVVSPDGETVRSIINDRLGESLHVLSGIHLESLARAAFQECARSGARMALMNEPPVPGPLRSRIAPLFHRAHRLAYGRRIEFILAIGHMGVRFYQSIGFPKDKVFPYGYFPPNLDHRNAGLTATDGPVQLLYLGQLVRRKGVDLLLKALASLRDLDYRVQIMGDGEQKEELVALAKKLGLADCVRFAPPAPNREAMKAVSGSDLLVLPSRHDGWGAVVNEALLRGVPVIASDRCGASDLLRDPSRGAVFRAGSASDLSGALRNWIAKGKRTEAERDKIKAWSACIAPESAANYLAEVIAYASDSRRIAANRPVAPWLVEPVMKDKREQTA